MCKLLGPHPRNHTHWCWAKTEGPLPSPPSWGHPQGQLEPRRSEGHPALARLSLTNFRSPPPTIPGLGRGHAVNSHTLPGVKVPTAAQAGPPCPLLPVPSLPRPRPLPCPLSSHPSLARMGDGCGLPAAGPQQPAVCPAMSTSVPCCTKGLAPEGEVTDTRNKTFPVPLTSAPALWLSQNMGSTCQRPKPLSGQPPSSAGRVGPLQV